MNKAMNRKCHAVASSVYGKNAHEALRGMASAAGFSSWADVPDAQAREILTELKAAQRAGTELIATARPGLSTRAQRDKISALRHAMGWSWTYIRQLVQEYGVDDWMLMTQQDADHLIQRMTQISANMRKRAQAKAHHTA
jgi:hypothetical protein